MESGDTARIARLRRALASSHAAPGDVPRLLRLDALLDAFEEVLPEGRTAEDRGGRARKISVSMPEELTTAVQRRVGRGEFSRYVTEAVARRLEADLLAELVALLEEEHGPVDEAALAEAEALWPDAD
ncbi:hypothetical protein PWG71_14865 [Nocardiopsis sp. N85]|uniref:hypothetical protein n=1 Tax=Nocardiopsis sp. N85 TaxID=3029400 RepID=UPI00237EEC09|nr:hypothetical protein [Nocardiopsis sp. N85]MDE3722669.1 hypothetical protein [Nocardiopsis sp. N85]